MSNYLRKNRCFLELYLDFLHVAELSSEGITLSRIMKVANMTYKRSKEAIDLGLRKGHISLLREVRRMKIIQNNRKRKRIEKVPGRIEK
ncbi:MAG: hypothetical protein QMD36_05820 [Candidatus Aenigmarchaeota archaeon]|nr:hypothetical protein [Candidatus Aenigmarchaeota archaeon]